MSGISKNIKLINEHCAHLNVDQSDAWKFPKLPIFQVLLLCMSSVSWVNRLVCFCSLDSWKVRYKVLSFMVTIFIRVIWMKMKMCHNWGQTALKGLSDVLPTSKSKNEAFSPHHLITMSAAIRASDLLEAASTPTLNGGNGGWLRIVLFTHLRTVSQQFCCQFSKSQKWFYGKLLLVHLRKGF